MVRCGECECDAFGGPSWAACCTRRRGDACARSTTAHLKWRAAFDCQWRSLHWHQRTISGIIWHKVRSSPSGCCNSRHSRRECTAIWLHRDVPHPLHGRATGVCAQNATHCTACCMLSPTLHTPWGGGVGRASHTAHSNNTRGGVADATVPRRAGDGRGSLAAHTTTKSAISEQCLHRRCTHLPPGRALRPGNTSCGREGGGGYTPAVGVLGQQQQQRATRPGLAAAPSAAGAVLPRAGIPRLCRGRDGE